MTIWFEESGPDGAPLVVLVHGAMDRGTAFAPVRRILSDRYRVIVYDRRGYARSLGAGGPFTVAQNRDDLEALLDGRTAVIGGHSFGGVVALALAEHRPDLVRAVAVYESPMNWHAQWPAEGMVRTTIGAMDPADIAEGFLRSVIGTSGWESLPVKIREARRAEGAALVAELHDAQGRAPYDPAALRVPLVIGRGTESVARHQLGATLHHRLVPGSELVEFPGASHGMHRSDPQGFASLVERAVELAPD